MVKILDKTENNYIIKLTKNEYFYLKNVLDEGEITDDEILERIKRGQYFKLQKNDTIK